MKKIYSYTCNASCPAPGTKLSGLCKPKLESESRFLPERITIFNTGFLLE